MFGQNQIYNRFVIPFTTLLLFTFHCSNQHSSIQDHIDDLQSAEGITNESLVVDNVATVDPNLPATGLIAIESAVVRRRVALMSNLYVLEQCGAVNANSVCLAGERELTIRRGVITGNDTIIKADSIRVARRVKLNGLTEYNEIKAHSKAEIANGVEPMGGVPALPTFLTGSPGLTEVNEDDSPLSPGSFGILTLGKKKTLHLTGGVYHFQSLLLKKKAELICETRCILLVAQDVRLRKRVQITTVSGNPHDMTLFVEGKSDSPDPNPDPDPFPFPDPGTSAAQRVSLSDQTETKPELPRSVVIGRRSQVAANIYAPNGAVIFRRRSQSSGTVIGRWLKLGRGSLFTETSSTESGVAAYAAAGEATTIAIDDKVSLEIPACALDTSQVISIIPTQSVSPTDPDLTLLGQAYKFEPAGLQFNCPVELTITEATTPEPTMAAGIFYSPDGDGFSLLETSNDSSNYTTGIEHFSIYVVAAYPSPNFSRSYDLLVQGNRLYVTYTDGLRVFNIGGVFEELPQMIGEATSTTAPVFHPDKLVKFGNYIYTTSHFGDFLYTFRILPSGVPQYESTVDLSTTTLCPDLAIYNNTLLISCQSGQLLKLDVTTDSANPVEIGSVSLNKPLGGVVPGFNMAVAGDFAYLGGVTNNMAIVDLTTDTVTFVASGGAHAIRDLSVDGNVMYVSGATSGLLSYELTTPLTPVYRSLISFGSDTMGHAISNNTVYSAYNDPPNGGITAVYAADPFNLQPINDGTITTNAPAEPRKIAVLNSNTAYVTARETGVITLDISDIEVPDIDWQQLGGLLNPTPSSSNYDPDLVINGGIPYVAARENLGHGGAYVKYFDGSDWQMLNGQMEDNPTASNFKPKLTFIGSTLYAAWMRFIPQVSNEVVVKYYDGSDWVQVGPVILPSLPQKALCIDLTNYGGRPWLAVTEEISGPQKTMYVLEWDGVSWNQVGSHLNFYAYNSNVGCPTFADHTEPYIAFTDESRSFVKRWNGSDWEFVGGVIKEQSVMRDIVVFNNEPYVVYQAEGTSFQFRHVLVSKFNGTDWEQIGFRVSNTAESGNLAKGASMTVVDDRLLVAWAQTIKNESHVPVQVKEWDGANWLAVSGELTSNDYSTNSLQLKASGNTVYLTFQQEDPPDINEIVVLSSELEQVSDPFTIGQPVEITGSNPAWKSDLAYNPNDDQYLLVWQEFISPGLNQVVRQVLDGNGQSITTTEVIETSALNQYNPQTIWNENFYNVVWTGSWTDPSQAINESLSAAGNTGGFPSIVLTDIPPFDALSGDVSAIFNFRLYAYLDSRHGAGQYDVSVVLRHPTTSWTTPTEITNNANTKTPPIMAQNGSIHMLVWTEDDGSDILIYKATIDQDSNVVTPATLITTTDIDKKPALASNGDGFVVTWFEQSVQNQTVLVAQAFDSNGSAINQPSVLSDEKNITFDSAVASNGDEYFVVWSEVEEQPILGDYLIKGQRLSATGQPISFAKFVETAGPLSRHPSVASNGNGYLVAWQNGGAVLTWSRMRTVKITLNP